MVYFRVAAETNRHVLLTPHGFVLEGTNGFFAPADTAADFLAFQVLDEDESRKEFGIVAPTNLAVWRVRVQVRIEDPYSPRRFAEFLKLWRYGIGPGLTKPFPVIWWYLWQASSRHDDILESDPITNAVAPEITK